MVSLLGKKVPVRRTGAYRHKKALIFTHRLNPSFAHFFGEFPVLEVGGGSGTRCFGPRCEAWGAHEAEISFQMDAQAGVLTSDLAI